MKNALALIFRCMIATAMVVSFIMSVIWTIDTDPGVLSWWLVFWGFAVVRYLQLIADTLMGLDRWSMLAKSLSDPFGDDAEKVAAKLAKVDARTSQADAEA